jgi:hypothetical protein
MAQVVERFCPEFRRVRDDPMRDLHAQVQLCGRRVDERIWGWPPVCPANVAGAERAILGALDRLDVGEGPFDPPARGC